MTLLDLTSKETHTFSLSEIGVDRIRQFVVANVGPEHDIDLFVSHITTGWNAGDHTPAIRLLGSVTSHGRAVTMELTDADIEDWEVGYKFIKNQDGRSALVLIDESSHE